MPHAKVLSVVIDCLDPVALAEFWATVVGGEVDTGNVADDWLSLKGVPAVGYLSFQRVPEHKASKNRVHLDLDTTDIAASTASAVAAGATVSGPLIDEGTNLLQVMLDPEGNEFCFIDRRA